MKIKSLLLSLALLGSIVGYAQSHDSELYRVPARKEIRHKVQQLSEFPVEQPVVTRASGEYIMQEFPTQGEIRGIVLLVKVIARTARHRGTNADGTTINSAIALMRNLFSIVDATITILQ